MFVWLENEPMPTMPQSETQQIELTVLLNIKETTQGGKGGALLYDLYRDVLLDWVWFFPLCPKQGILFPSCPKQSLF